MKPTTPAAESANTTQPTESASQSTQRPSANSLKAGDQGKETVLVVDDEPLVRQLMVHLLQRFGYRVLEASGFLEAQRLAETNEKIHLLLTDFSMPEMNGVELAHWFQAKYPAMKVLIATGSLWGFVNQVGEQELAVLAKPFDAAQLERMVRLILDEPQGAQQPAICA